MKITKLLLPLGTLVAAGAIAVGSGATFTSTTANSISSVTSGTLTQTNSKDQAAIFTLTNAKPGDIVNGKLTITNTGSLPADFTLTETVSTNGFKAENLRLTITNKTTGAEVYTGTFGGLKDGDKKALGTIAAGTANDFVFSAQLDKDADNTEQGKTATAAFQWDSVQQAATTSEQ
ncbi:CalY family protein [Aeromicrobium wangtongii]|uniref:CalY family protein n=1 Tax=Aeromicrobium wangtongii TaxID=2969247 RepID=A0ABY5MAY6_9ACTN|nr:CalY family protein [Aeromicrobium wangtongii]MCD9199804.1 CalY family protein [Aeromicrobium wangtongii]MCD9199805.1 CalY family protein [Aeromicrobium wangtongii]UUP14154.1 CalY family protein [Aeromicrobium wangtongii]UUP14155.1 CalY family protein [Aeromicrobium wangtongii]UUP14156.1 CalY family protein [Aeromicrobium wangtongii]